MFINSIKSVLNTLKLTPINLRFSSSTNFNLTNLNKKFTNEEEKKILEILNTSNVEQLSRFEISQGRIKKLEIRKGKKGPFKSLVDVLDVEGLGVKVLDKLCESILNDQSSPKKATSKNRRHFLVPPLTHQQTCTLSSAVGLHLAPAGISWAKLNRDENCLSEWDFHNFSALPKKMLPTETFHLAMQILNEIPTGEIYVFEAAPSISPHQKQTAMLSSYNQHLELTSMLLALLNTSSKHTNVACDEKDYANFVYHLRANLSARLFNTLMGTERVASTTTISKLLDADDNFSLPCNRISLGLNVRERYFSHQPVARELLGQALLLIITFMDLCVYRNAKSLAAVAPARRNICECARDFVIYRIRMTSFISFMKKFQDSKIRGVLESAMRVVGDTVSEKNSIIMVELPTMCDNNGSAPKKGIRSDFLASF